MESRANTVLADNTDGRGVELAPRLLEGEGGLYCCEQQACAPVPPNTVLYLNAEHLPRQVYLEATGRGVHCDCVVVAPCGEDRLALVAYELKSLRRLSGIVAELVSPRRSGHGSGQAAEELIRSHDLVEKFVACLRVAYGLVERLNLQPDTVVAALVRW